MFWGDGTINGPVLGNMVRGNVFTFIFLFVAPNAKSLVQTEPTKNF